MVARAVPRAPEGRLRRPEARPAGALQGRGELRAQPRHTAQTARHRKGQPLPSPEEEGNHDPPGVQRLAARLGDVPIGVFTADWSLVWWNATWSALHGDPAALPEAERNLARALFGSGAAHASMLPVRSERGQDAFEASIVADLKDAVSRYPADARLDRLVRELRAESPGFARHWAAGTAAVQHTTDRKTIRHPSVGEILLDCDVLIVPGADLRMVTYTAATGSGDAEKLDLLRVTGGRVVTGAKPGSNSASG